MLDPFAIRAGQVLLTHDGNFRLRAKGHGIPVCKLGPGAGDAEVEMPASRKELLERFFPDVIPSPQQVPLPRFLHTLGPGLSHPVLPTLEVPCQC